MPWKSLLPQGFAGLLCVLVFQAAPAEDRVRRTPQFKKPLDVLMDEKGTTARVFLAGTGKVAVVDLIQGRIKHENAGKRGVRSDISFNLALFLKTKFAYSRNPEIFMCAACATPKTKGADGPLKKPITVLVVDRYSKIKIPTTQIAQGWVFTHTISVYSYPRMLGLSGNPTEHTATLDDTAHSAADPSDVVITSDDKLGFVGLAGSDTVLAIDVNRLRTFLSRRSQASHTKKPQSFLDLTASRHFVVARLSTQANPRRLGLSGDGKTLVVTNYLADSLTVIDVPSLKVRRQIPLGGPKADATRRGEILFNSARMTFQGQFTCASCHPNGGSDGLVWDLTRDGIGNFKKTKSLLGVKDTAPYGWHGSSPTLADRVAGTLRTLHRHEPSGTEVADIVAYLRTLKAPEPPAVPKKDKPAVDRGRALFLGQARCATCHRPPTFQDGKLHDIGTRGPTDTQDAFDTPSLRGVSRTPPYLHDGRAMTLEEVLAKHDGDKRHGAAHKLTRAEFADLIAYLQTL